MDDKRNIITFVIFSAIILIGWQFVAERFFPTPAAPPAVVAGAGANKGAAVGADGTAPAAGTAAVPPSAASASASSSATVSLPRALAASARIPIETPTLRGSIALKGARIDDLVLLRYRQSVEKNSPPVRLFAPSGTAKAYFAGLGWNGAGLNAPTAETVWQAPAGARLTPDSPVTLTHDNGQGQIFTITLSIDKNYMFSAKQSMTNAGAAPVSVGSFAFLSRKGAPSPDVDGWTMNTGAMGVFDGIAQWFDTADLDAAPGGSTRLASKGGWVGFTDHFWLGALIPDQAKRVDAGFRHGEGNVYQSDYALPERIVPAGGSLSETSRIFAGAKETRLLDAYTDGGIPHFDRATDWGWFWFIAKPIFYLLDWLFQQIKNFGLAIMALTVIIRLLTFPIAQRQFSSMAQMRVVQPRLKALQEKYKDDKPKLQAEMMQLYKTEKINPLAGCLPIFIQIPIFYSLYKCLMLTVEMRHQPFMLWIKDLSAPDPLHILNLFGAIDNWGPPFLHIGVLAILLGVTMWLQFSLNPPAADPVQQQVMAIMPWMMTFMMAPFASGLLVYYITNNILAIGQQKMLYAKYPEMKAPLPTATAPS